LTNHHSRVARKVRNFLCALRWTVASILALDGSTRSFLVRRLSPNRQTRPMPALLFEMAASTGLY
jgi:hypothetical protein